MVRVSMSRLYLHCPIYLCRSPLLSEILAKTSRSFALVIQELGNQLRDAVCIFYLVLRGLDTVEDDRNFPLEPRVALLRDFFNKLDQPGWTFDKAGENEHERELLRNFDKVMLDGILSCAVALE